MSKLPIVVSRDGRLGLAVTEFEGVHGVPNRNAIGAYFSVRLTPTAAESRLAVLFSGTVLAVKWEAFGLPAITEEAERLGAFAEAAIGEYLDEHGLPEATPSGVAAYQVECFSPTFNAWSTRPRASDEVIEAYIAAKLYWGWKFDQMLVAFDMPDYLRLRAPRETLARVAQVGMDQLWTWHGGTPTTFSLSPTSEFLRQQQKTIGAGPTASPGEQLLRQLQAPRYAGPREHWLKAMDFAHGSKRDLANAAKEAVCAVEAIARLLAGDHTATLGALIKQLKGQGRISPAMGKMLDGLWGFTSNEPGVRHGAPYGSEIDEAETQYILDSAVAVLRYMLDQDR